MSCEGNFSDPAPATFSPASSVSELSLGEQGSGLLAEECTCESSPLCTDSESKPFSFLLWNVEGLKPFLSDRDFLSFLHDFDFICLVETFMEELTDYQKEVFAGFKPFCSPAVKLSDKPGRRSGGIVCLIKNELSSFVQLLAKHPNFCAFLIDKELFGLDKDVLYMCSYVHPKGSPFYTFSGIDNGINVIEEYLVNFLVSSDVYVILSGDLNSRTSNVSQNLTDSVFNTTERSQCPTVNRCSEDCYVNDFGKLLLNMCTTVGLCILNGVCKGDQHGRCTYFCDSGSSAIDLFVFSNDLFSLVYDSCELCVVDRIESKHFPVTTRISFPCANPVACDDGVDDYVIEKYVWNEETSHVYHDNLLDENLQTNMNIAFNLIDTNVDAALNMFNNCIKESASCMKKRVSSRMNVSDDWFDRECVVARRNVRRLLRNVRRSVDPVARQQFVISRREYKNLLKRKKQLFNKSLLDKLVMSIQNQKEFWNTIRRSTFKRKQIRNSITSDRWFQHFRSLLQTEVNEVLNVDLDDNEIDTNMNRPISAEEVLLAVSKLRNRKAAGPDGIIGELFKHSGEHVVSFFVKLFNKIFDDSIFPCNWTESIILPIFKKGNVNDPGNYRGISLCDISSKVFSTIINSRIQEWVEQHNITGDHQAGFKKGYSTVDHMFTLLAMIQKQFSLNRKLYVAFIDFEKAFDSINRNLLWPILLKNGINGKLFKCIRSMYALVKARVRCGGKLTDSIDCTAGLRQGDACSPVLFSLFINELAVDIIKNGRHGAMLSLDAFELFILLLADDIILVSETVVGLQTQLNNLHRAAASLQLKVNLGKSNIIVFRKGGYLGRRENWKYGNLTMPVVNAYKYLGILFSTRLSFTAACKDLASRGKNALFHIMRKLYALDNNSFTLLMKLFDSQIQPMVLYGSELWGLDQAAVHCETVHTYALKRFLGVDRRTPNDLVYGETNRYPIHIKAAVNCIRYWFKLLQMDNSRIPRKAYDMLFSLDARGKENWVSKVREFLFKYGFGIVWECQGVGSVNGFIKVFRQRLVDCSWQKWRDHIQTSERFNVYSTFCDVPCLQPYLAADMGRQLKFITTKFRFGISDLMVHYYRYRQFNDNDLLCPLCKLSEDNEIHFVLCCPVLEGIREQFIRPKYYRQPSLFKLSLLMSSTVTEVVRNFSLFLYKAFKLRELSLS